jgi:pimeloyl-ACP methyl ester carboxylesterase
VLPHARLVTVPGCGHLALVECRSRTLPEIERFLDAR